MKEKFTGPEKPTGPESSIKESGRLIENQELGITYTEEIIPLPPHRRLETGISRIRKRELIKIPPQLICKMKPPLRGYHPERPFLSLEKETWPIYRYLTDGNFPSWRTWSHVVMADFWTAPEIARESIDRFKKELLYFQEIFPLERIKFNTSFTTFFAKRSDGRIEREPEPMPREMPGMTWEQSNHYEMHIREDFLRRAGITDVKKALSIFFMSLSSGEYSWVHRYDMPVFIFGNRNKNLLEYVRAIQSHPETREMLNWVGEDLENPPPLRRLTKKFLTDLYSRSSRSGLVYVPPEWQMFRGYKNLLIPDVNAHDTKKVQFHYLKFLAEGKKIYIPFGHPMAPIVRHPDIKPLRWCHAETALIPTYPSPTELSLNVLFFERE